MTITAEQAAKLHGTLPGVQTAMMNGDCLAVLLCSYFDDGEPNPDSDNGWSERAEAGYAEVIAAIRAHYDPVIRALIASEAARKLAEDRLVKVRAAFRVNMLRLDPTISHEAIDALFKEIDNG